MSILSSATCIEQEVSPETQTLAFRSEEQSAASSFLRKPKPTPPCTAKDSHDFQNHYSWQRQLPSYFINRFGEVEPSLLSTNPEVLVGWSSDPVGFHCGLATLTEQQAHIRLLRACAETGQLIIRSQDALVDAWFVGFGETAILFVEIHLRGMVPKHDQPTTAGVCTVNQAKQLVEEIFAGYCASQLLESLANKIERPPLAKLGVEQPSGVDQPC